MSFKLHKLAEEYYLCMIEASYTLKAHEKIPMLADIHISRYFLFTLLFDKMQAEFMLKSKTSSNPLRWKKLNMTHCLEKYTVLQIKMTK